jgi:hypothetical protein
MRAAVRGRAYRKASARGGADGATWRSGPKNCSPARLGRVIVADTSAIVALIDADDRHHERLRAAFEVQPGDWILPWAILPEVDYLLLHHVGAEAELAFVRDVAEGRWPVES